MISEHDHLAALAKVIRQCAAAMCPLCASGVPFIESVKYSGRHQCVGVAWSNPAEGVTCVASVILALLTPAMLEAEKQNAANSSNTQQMS